jgi:hypothetical protein
MAGIDFMALATGMMQGDKLNKEDDTYWRKQDADDRNQAYKEKSQGYMLDDAERQAQNADYKLQDVQASRLANQAYDTYANAAKAQGIPVHQLLLNSPEFNLPNATPEMQAAFNGKMRAGPIAEVVRGLRSAGKFDEAAAVETKFGIGISAKENPMSFMGDSAKVDAHISKTLGASKNEDGTYTFAGVTVSPSQAFAFTNMRPADVLASVANLKAQQDVQTKNAAAQSGLEKSNANTAEQEARRIIYKFQSEGANRSIVNPSLHGLWDEMAAARAQAGGAAGAGAKPVDPLTAMTTQPAMPVTPGWVTEQRNAMPAAPQQAAMPAQTSGSPAATVPWQDAITKYKETQTANITLGKKIMELQDDLSNMQSGSARGHFDAATIARVRGQLADAQKQYRTSTDDLKNSMAAVHGANENRYRPAYIDALANKYKAP